MFQREYLERWEADAVSLDEEGFSEDYFPLWGVADTDDYLRSSNKLRQELAQAAEAEAAEEAAALAEVDSAVAQLQEGKVPSAGKRVAWGAWFWVKRVIVVLLVCAVGSLLVTMVMNPTLAFFDAADLLLGRAADLIGRING